MAIVEKRYAQALFNTAKNKEENGKQLGVKIVWYVYCYRADNVFQLTADIIVTLKKIHRLKIILTNLIFAGYFDK